MVKMLSPDQLKQIDLFLAEPVEKNFIPVIGIAINEQDQQKCMDLVSVLRNVRTAIQKDHNEDIFGAFLRRIPQTQAKFLVTKFTPIAQQVQQEQVLTGMFGGG
jgi:hypothetical protein